MLRYYRVSQLSGYSNFSGYRSVLARDAGDKLHKHLAQLYAKGGKHYQPRYHVEEPVVGVLCDLAGDPCAILSGTPDLFWFEGSILYVVDHKTKPLGDSLYWSSSYITQLVLYALLILANHPGSKVLRVKLSIWFYYRQENLEDSEKIVKQADIESMYRKDLTKKALESICDSLKEKVTLVGLHSLALKSSH